MKSTTAPEPVSITSKSSFRCCSRTATCPSLSSDATGMPATVVELARAGNLIAAIKEYRRITGAGLAEAKKAVEDIR